MRQTTRDTEPPPPPEELIRCLSRFELSIGEIALALRQMVLEEAPGATEKLFDGYVLAVSYSFSTKWSEGICYVSVHAKHCNLGFNRGAELPDPDGLLVGEGKILRHLKVKTSKDLKQPHVRRFIRAAIKHSKISSDRRPTPAKSKAAVSGRAVAKKKPTATSKKQRAKN